MIEWLRGIVVASAPALPDVREGMAVYLRSKTDAEDKVVRPGEQGRSASPPRIIVSHDGSIGQLDNVIERARIVIDSYGKSPDQARRLAYQARDAILPIERGPWGLYAIVNYTDPEDDTARTITLSGAFLESGPRESADSRNRVVTSYLVTYF